MIYSKNNKHKYIAIDPTMLTPTIRKKCKNICSHSINCLDCKGNGLCNRCEYEDNEGWKNGMCINWWIMKSNHLKIVKLDCLHNEVDVNKDIKKGESSYIKLNNGVNYII